MCRKIVMYFHEAIWRQWSWYISIAISLYYCFYHALWQIGSKKYISSLFNLFNFVLVLIWEFMRNLRWKNSGEYRWIHYKQKYDKQVCSIIIDHNFCVKMNGSKIKLNNSFLDDRNSQGNAKIHEGKEYFTIKNLYNTFNVHVIHVSIIHILNICKSIYNENLSLRKLIIHYLVVFSLTARKEVQQRLANATRFAIPRWCIFFRRKKEDPRFLFYFH